MKRVGRPTVSDVHLKTEEWFAKFDQKCPTIHNLQPVRIDKCTLIIPFRCGDRSTYDLHALLVSTLNKDLISPYWYNRGRSRFYATITFDDEARAQDTIQLINYIEANFRDKHKSQILKQLYTCICSNIPYDRVRGIIDVDLKKKCPPRKRMRPEFVDLDVD